MGWRIFAKAAQGSGMVSSPYEEQDVKLGRSYTLPWVTRTGGELLCSASKREVGTLRSQEGPVGPAQVETSSLFYFLFWNLNNSKYRKLFVVQICSDFEFEQNLNLKIFKFEFFSKFEQFWNTNKNLNLNKFWKWTKNKFEQNSEYEQIFKFEQILNLNN
jgi:hypothetical protein